MAKIGEDILKAKDLLENGQLVAIPTETVYGLAANALNLKAVTGIFEVKNRPSFDPLIIHTDTLEKVKLFVKEIPGDLELLMNEFWPGPLTVLLPKDAIIPDLVTAGLERVAVRIPQHPLTLALLKSLNFPLAAPSANPFGYISPTTVEHVNKQLGNKIDYILDGGECEVGLESTIVGFENDKLTVYRKGGLANEAIEKVVGKVNLKEHSSSNPAAPGMMKSHYAPNKQVILLDIGLFPESSNNLNNVGFLRFSETIEQVRLKNQFILSPTGDINEAAQNLFKGLRYLDSLDIDTVYVELVPEKGLGRAINDRLRRAATIPD